MTHERRYSNSTWGQTWKICPTCNTSFTDYAGVIRNRKYCRTECSPIPTHAPHEYTHEIVRLWREHPDLNNTAIAEIAEVELSMRVTKNMVIGAVNRHVSKEERMRRMPKHVIYRVRRNLQVAQARKMEDEVREHLTLMEDLKPRMCRYPHGNEKPYHFCGAETEHGESYCAAHQALTRIPSSTHRYRSKKERGGVPMRATLQW